MKARNVLLGLLAVTTAIPSAASAQFTSEIPGVPRAGVPWNGHAQGRVGIDLSGFRIEEETGIHWVGRAGVDWGRSYRIGPNLEVGFDLGLASGLLDNYRPAEDQTDEGPITASEVVIGYGVTVGAKLRPISYLSTAGHGFEAAIAASFRYGSEPVFAYEMVGDSSRTGGLFVGADSDSTSGTEEDLLLESASAVGGGLILSYRTPRIMADVALMFESASGTERRASRRL